MSPWRIDALELPLKFANYNPARTDLCQSPTDINHARTCVAHRDAFAIVQGSSSSRVSNRLTATLQPSWGLSWSTKLRPVFSASEGCDMYVLPSITLQYAAGRKGTATIAVLHIRRLTRCLTLRHD